jgi:RimJ/RimL family protein N-acetyltransferase
MPTLPDAIETARLRLRPFHFEDIDDILALGEDPEMARYMSMPQPFRRADAERVIARQILADPNERFGWAAELEGAVVGWVNLIFDRENRRAEVGYGIARDHWGKGLATEAARAAIDAAFATFPDLNRVRAMADARNIGSQRVMEKLGMKREGVLRQNQVVRGEFIDEAWYGLLRSEWEGQRRQTS